MIAVLRAVDAVSGKRHLEQVELKIGDIARLTKKSPRAVRRAIAELREQKLLIVKENRRGGWKESTYRIVWPNIRAIVDEANELRASGHDDKAEWSPGPYRVVTMTGASGHGDHSRESPISTPEKENPSLFPERFEGFSEEEQVSISVLHRRMMNCFVAEATKRGQKVATKVHRLRLEEYIFRIAVLRSTGELSEHAFDHALHKSQALLSPKGERIKCPAYYFDKCLQTELGKNPSSPSLESLLSRIPGRRGVPAR
jgi:DNA-binding transcriptional ArsR family regulator